MHTRKSGEMKRNDSIIPQVFFHIYICVCVFLCT